MEFLKRLESVRRRRRHGIAFVLPGNQGTEPFPEFWLIIYYQHFYHQSLAPYNRTPERTSSPPELRE
ncbi:hypothetical protein D3C73_1556940 [compost metagenome]